jgi:hypothetical protein
MQRPDLSPLTEDDLARIREGDGAYWREPHD